MKKNETSVIIANWNGRKLLKPCLDSLRKQSYKDFDVIVVDNASSDGSAEFVMKNYPEVKLLRLKKNMAFTGGNNAGLKEALRNPSLRYVVTLNNDTVADKDWLKNLVSAAASDKNMGSCSSKVLFLHDKGIVDTAGIVVYKDGHAHSAHHREKASRVNKKEEVFGSSAVAALWKREMIDKVGFFDSMFRMYQEEVDLAWRMRYAGYKAVFVPDAVVYHAHSASSGPFSPLKAYYSERNRIWLVFKNFTCLMMLKSKYYTWKRYMALAGGMRRKEGAAARFAEKHSLMAILWVLAKAYFIGVLLLPLFIPKRIRIQLMRLRNRIGRKQINRWFDKFGISAERIALVK